MVAAPSDSGVSDPHRVCFGWPSAGIFDGRVTGQTSWPPPCTDLAACGQFFMAANRPGTTPTSTWDVHDNQRRDWWDNSVVPSVLVRYAEVVPARATSPCGTALRRRSSTVTIRSSTDETTMGTAKAMNMVWMLQPAPMR
jgi:hypothetical protein